MENSKEANSEGERKGERTVVTEVGKILGGLFDVIHALNEKTTEDDFYQFFMKTWLSNLPNEFLRKKFFAEYDLVEKTLIPPALLLSLSHCVDALKEYTNNPNGGWTYVSDASYYLGVAAGCHACGIAALEARSGRARQAAQKKISRDPRQAEKMFAYGCWKEWQKKPERYASKAAFARDMLDKCQHLISVKKIEDFCREWEKSNQG